MGIPTYSSVFIAGKVHDFLVSAEANDAQPWLVIATPPAPHPPFAAEAQYSTASVPSMSTNPAMTEADTSDKPSWIPRSTSTTTGFGRTYVKMERTLLSADDMVIEPTWRHLRRTRTPSRSSCRTTGTCWASTT